LLAADREAWTKVGSRRLRAKRNETALPCSSQIPLTLPFMTHFQAKAAIFEYIEVFYNHQRRHSRIGYKTPQQAFNNITWRMAAWGQ
jgi:transposase InsO family protein